MLSATECVRKKGKGISETLASYLTKEWSTFFNDVVWGKFDSHCDRLLNKERRFGTLNHYFEAKCEEFTMCPDEHLEALLGMVSEDVFVNKERGTMRLKNILEVRNTLEELYQKARTIVVEQRRKADLHARQRVEVHREVRAHWQVEHKT